MISKKNQAKLKVQQNKLIQRLRLKEIEIRSEREIKGTVELEAKVRDNNKGLL